CAEACCNTAQHFMRERAELAMGMSASDGIDFFSRHHNRDLHTIEKHGMLLMKFSTQSLVCGELSVLVAVGEGVFHHLRIVGALDVGAERSSDGGGLQLYTVIFGEHLETRYHRCEYADAAVLSGTGDIVIMNDTLPSILVLPVYCLPFHAFDGVV